MRPRILAVLLAVTVAGCTTQAPRGFDTAMREGASCAELFEIRNRETNEQTIERLNVRLRNVGCYSSTSRRTD